MTTKPIDRDRFQITLWKVEKLIEDIQDIDKRLAAFSELKATTYTIGPKERDTKHSIVEDVAIKREELQDEKQVKEFEFQLARFELSGELDRLYVKLWPKTIQMIRDYYVMRLDPCHMKQRYGENYIDKLHKATG